MGKKTITGLVLVAAAFTAVWAAGMASAGEVESKAPEVHNTILTGGRPNTSIMPPASFG